MSDYISKSALIEDLKNDFCADCTECGGHCRHDDLFETVEKQLTISETEIIRKPFERVVERLEEAVNVNKEKGCEMQTKELYECALIGFSRMNAFLDAIEIVKEECGIE